MTAETAAVVDAVVGAAADDESAPPCTAALNAALFLTPGLGGSALFALTCAAVLLCCWLVRGLERAGGVVTTVIDL